MLQAELISQLGIADSTFRAWRSALGIPAKKAYDDSDVERFTALKNATDNGQRFDEAVAEITGKPVNENSNPLADAVTKGFKPQLQKQADITGQALAIAFEDMVWGSFLKHVGKSKGSRFEECANNFSLAVDGDEPLEAFLIEGSSDEG